MPIGVDHDQSVRCLEDHTIAVGLAIRGRRAMHRAGGGLPHPSNMRDTVRGDDASG
jgi:hypothetical protein